MTCPRCGSDIEGQRFYGPCEACRAGLRAKPVEYTPDSHFVASTRQDGTHMTEFKPCGKTSCPIPACQP